MSTSSEVRSPGSAKPVTVAARKEKLTSYGGDSVVAARYFEPADECELRTIFEEARGRNESVTFRTGGRAFDTHSLNDEIVISLGKLAKIEVEADAATVTVGPGATWGRILEETVKHGYVPYVMVTSSDAAAGGTVSADCLSRFSPTCHKEGDHVVALRVITLDGTPHQCSASENAELFHGVVGGLGALGAVVEITYALMRVPGEGPIRVESTFTPFTGVTNLAAELVAGVERAKAAKGPTFPPDASGAKALSAALYMNAKREGFLMESRYVRSTTKPTEKGSILHQPSKPLHLALQFFSLFELTRRLGWWIMLRTELGTKKTYSDELVGYTFFQNGNERIKKWGRALGLPLRLRQQTFVVDGDALGDFLSEADRMLDERGLLPSLIDVLYVPEDRLPFLLSSGNGRSGYAVTFTFERLFGKSLAKEEKALRDIAALCHARNGRVHLVKHVFAEAEEIGAQYRNGIDGMKTLKQRFDPASRLSSAFLRRVLPTLVS